MRALAWTCLLLSSLAVAEPWDVPPPPKGQWLVDETGKLQPSTVAEVNALAAKLEASGVAQLGVLVTRTTSGVKPRDFATGAFNSWGVGHAGANDGVLLFIAVDDRKAEIILGDGAKIGTDVTDEVMREQVIAHMKQADLDGAVLSAAKALVEAHPGSAGKGPVEVRPLEPSDWVLGLGCLSSPFLGLGGLATFFVRRSRRKTRVCSKCGGPRQLLDEVADDAHLTPGQRTEEQVRSVNYDVWYCAPCHDSFVVPKGRWFSGYDKCPECHAKTRKTETFTITAATEYSTGEQRVEERCANCSYALTFTRTIPRVVSSSDSSSSSSDSSFGGGSSSGSGSSGSW